MTKVQRNSGNGEEYKENQMEINVLLKLQMKRNLKKLTKWSLMKI